MIIVTWTAVKIVFPILKMLHLWHLLVLCTQNTVAPPFADVTVLSEVCSWFCFWHDQVDLSAGWNSRYKCAECCTMEVTLLIEPRNCTLNSQMFTSQMGLTPLSASQQQPRVKHSYLNPTGKQRIHQLDKQSICPQWEKKRIQPKTKSMHRFYTCVLVCVNVPASASSLHHNLIAKKKKKKCKRRRWIIKSLVKLQCQINCNWLFRLRH